MFVLLLIKLLIEVVCVVGRFSSRVVFVIWKREFFIFWIIGVFLVGKCGGFEEEVMLWIGFFLYMKNCIGCGVMMWFLGLV